jgi:hypothetical protein
MRKEAEEQALKAAETAIPKSPVEQEPKADTEEEDLGGEAEDPDAGEGDVSAYASAAGGCDEAEEDQEIVFRVSEASLDLQRLGSSRSVIRLSQVAAERPPLGGKSGRASRPSSAPQLEESRATEPRPADGRSLGAVQYDPSAAVIAGKGKGAGGAGAVFNNPGSAAPKRKPQEYLLTPDGNRCSRKPSEELLSWEVLSTRLSRTRELGDRKVSSDVGAQGPERQNMRSTRSEGGASSHGLSRLSAFNVKLQEAVGHEAFPQALWGVLQDQYEQIEDPLTELDD